MRHLTISLLLATVCACESTPPMFPDPAATIDIGAAPSVVGLADTARLSVTVRGESGNVILGRAISWSATDSTVLTVTGAGLVTGISSGSSSVIAAVDGVADTVVITVQ